MSVKITERSDIPAALPIAEESGEMREKLLLDAAKGAEESAEKKLGIEPEEDDFDEIHDTPQPRKKKLFLAFTGFCFFIFFLFFLVSWFFGIGTFAKAKTETVDRSAKTNSPDAEKPQTEEEKLKMALDLVAEKNTGDKAGTVSIETPNLKSTSSVEIPPENAVDLEKPVIVPDLPPDTMQKSVNTGAVKTSESIKPPIGNIPTDILNPSNAERIPGSILTSQSSTEFIAPRGRSVFFGIEREKSSPLNQFSKTSDSQANFERSSANLKAQPIPFGTLLPVRTLGAVYTLRSSGGLVRMELTRAVAGKNYSYPAGTVIVGSLRGGERDRAFISIVGLIDPESGGLVKLTGEVMGGDGASGVPGRKRKVKGNWSRVLKGLRDGALAALGAIGGRGSGGTVIISDSASKATGSLSSELSGIIGNDRNTDVFVEIPSGTNGFVLITDLPDAITDTESLNANSKSATGLSEEELADLFSEGSREKIRAALPRMTPQFRRLAEQALETEGK